MHLKAYHVHNLKIMCNSDEQCAKTLHGFPKPIKKDGDGAHCICCKTGKLGLVARRN